MYYFFYAEPPKIFATGRHWIEGLIYKLIQQKIPTYIIKLIDSYLTNRNFTVNVNNANSRSKQVKAGVQEGSFLARGSTRFTWTTYHCLRKQTQPCSLTTRPFMPTHLALKWLTNKYKYTSTNYKITTTTGKSKLTQTKRN